MARIDYGQVPQVEPDFENSRLVRRHDAPGHCENLKYIDNKYLNSPNKSYCGFSLVGISKITGNWRILKVWGYW